MQGIESITNRIIEDANAQASDIIKKAYEAATAIIEDATATSGAETEKMIRAGKEKALQAAMRIKAAAVMENRKNKLRAKQELIESIFSSAEAKIKALPDTDYFNILQKLIVAYAKTGDEEILFSESDFKRLPTNYEQVVNNTVKQYGMEGRMKISSLPGNIGEGGFILRRGDIDINATFSSIVKLHRDELELLVAGVLF
jgi:V/A-type H+-transporting ATPase subunit E